jgi:hypothetical protein
MSNDPLFVERRPDGRYNVSKAHAERASAVTGTQKEAIDKARAMNPGGPIHVERVRNVETGHRDKWRKP